MQSQNDLSGVDVSSLDVELAKINLRKKKLRAKCLSVIDDYISVKGIYLTVSRRNNITHLQEVLAGEQKYKTADIVALYIWLYITNPQHFQTGFLGRSDLRKRLLGVIEHYCPVLLSTHNNNRMRKHYYELVDALGALIGTVEPLLGEAKKYKELLAEAANSAERTQDALNNLNSIIEEDVNESTEVEIQIDKNTLIKINNAIKDLKINLAIEKKNVVYYKQQYDKAELKIELLQKNIALKNTLIENLREEIAKKEADLRARNFSVNRSPGSGPISSPAFFQPTIQLEDVERNDHTYDDNDEKECKQPSSVSLGYRVNRVS